MKCANGFPASHGRPRGSCCPDQMATTHDTNGTQADEAGPNMPSGMRERDWQVLREMAHGVDAVVGFQGIKRRLDLHPEALRRSLKRLVEDGYVAKEPQGYRLSDKGQTTTGPDLAARHHIRAMPVAMMVMPSTVDPGLLVDRFSRRWFDGLHWYGLQEGPDVTVLSWMTERDNALVRMRIAALGIRIEAVVGDADPDVRLAAAAPLVQAVAELVRTQKPPAAS